MDSRLLDMENNTSLLVETARTILDNMRTVFLGKDMELKLSLMTLLSGGHLLIEDVPGVGKTVLARTLAKSLGCEFSRIQFTPDLLPSDVTGVSVFSSSTGEFQFKPGPILSQIVLADEVNRATPKTQSALLEAMEEGQVTVDGATHLVGDPHMVIATQNPIEYEGTFPLPEAQLDRFLIRLHVGYPRETEEIAIMDGQQYKHPIDDLKAVATGSDIAAMKNVISQVHVDSLVKQYIVRIVNRTREHPDIYLGSSPRGSIGLMRLAQASAFLAGRAYVDPDDVRELAPAVLSHRLIMHPSVRPADSDSMQVTSDILEEIPVPGMNSRLGPSGN